MVNTLRQVQSPHDDQPASELIADQLEVRPSVMLSPRPLIIEGGTETSLRDNEGTSNTTGEESAFEVRLKASIHQSIESAMMKQQEQFMKILEDRDNNIRHLNAREGSALNNKVGDKRKGEELSRKFRQQRLFEGNRGQDNQRKIRQCNRCRRSHVGLCDAHQSESPLTCNKCKKVGHFMRDCPIKGFVCFECREPGHAKRDCPRLKTEGSGKSKLDSPKATEGAFQISTNEARWCDRCKKSHIGSCRSSQYQDPLTCIKCGKTGHFIKDCPVKGIMCFECHEQGHVRKDCPKLIIGGSGRPNMEMSKPTGKALQMSTEEARSLKDME